ncbi:hypothetical protein F5Y15DRAFT_264145 [Xylariaceae sp. FL0016]|nr:hypothetical protein F5Y15DRAFT_264145 [Xylariaceae sp. FL0016]
MLGAGVSCGRGLSLPILLSFLIACILLSTLRLYGRQPAPRSIYDYTEGKTRGARLNETKPMHRDSEETAYLRYLVQQYGLSRELPYSSQRIQPVYSEKKWKSMTETSSNFMPNDFEWIHADDEELDLQAGKTVKLPLARSAAPSEADASALIFGISTSYGRLIHANSSLIHDWARWLTDGNGRSNGASLVLTLQRASSAEVGYIMSKIQEAGIEAIVLAADDKMDNTARYLDVIQRLAHRRYVLSQEGSDKSFFALIDDDVFFPSMNRLMSRLGDFDAEDEIYLGMPSERADWVVENNVTLTYGGGAIFFSGPMLDTLRDIPCLDATAHKSTFDSKTTSQWDEHLYTCISRHTSRDLVLLPSLYTPADDDDDDDAAVFAGLRTGYESGVPALSLHHYRHRHRFAAGPAHLIASLCGDASFLQRFRFRDGWVLVNGHSVSQYPDGVDVVPLRASPSLLTAQQDHDIRAQTQTQPESRLRIVKGPAAAGDGAREDRVVVSWAGTKRTWRLLDARVTADGAVWQAYVKRRGSILLYGDEDDHVPDDTIHTQDGPVDHDSVIVLMWEP